MKKYIFTVFCSVSLFASEFVVSGGFNRNFVFNDILCTSVAFNATMSKYCYNLELGTSLMFSRLTSNHYRVVHESKDLKKFDDIRIENPILKDFDEGYATYFISEFSAIFSGDKMLFIDSSTMVIGIELLNVYTKYDFRYVPAKSIKANISDGTHLIPIAQGGIPISEIKKFREDLHADLIKQTILGTVTDKNLFFLHKDNYLFPMGMSFTSLNLGIFIETDFTSGTEYVNVLCKSSLLFSFFNKLTVCGDVKNFAFFLQKDVDVTVGSTPHTTLGLLNMDTFNKTFNVHYSSVFRNSITCAMRGFSSAYIGMNLSLDILLTSLKGEPKDVPMTSLIIQDFVVSMLARRVSVGIKCLCGFSYD